MAKHTNSNEKKTSTKTGGILAVGAVIAALVILIWAYWYPNWVIKNYSCLDDAGKFGDMFGSLNALFTGLAFAGLITTIFLQRQDLAIQSQELREGREEFKKQNNTLRRQRFDNTFFNLVQFREQQLQYLKIHDGHTEYIGRDMISFVVGILTPHVAKLHYAGNFNQIRDEFKAALSVNFSSHQEKLNTYIRNLTSIFDFISKTTWMKKESKLFYLSLLLSQLNDNERTFLVYSIIFSDSTNRLEQQLIDINKTFRVVRKLDIRLHHPTHQLLIKALEDEAVK